MPDIIIEERRPVQKNNAPTTQRAVTTAAPSPETRPIILSLSPEVMKYKRGLLDGEYGNNGALNPEQAKQFITSKLAEFQGRPYTDPEVQTRLREINNEIIKSGLRGPVLVFNDEHELTDFLKDQLPDRQKTSNHDAIDDATRLMKQSQGESTILHAIFTIDASGRYQDPLVLAVSGSRDPHDLTEYFNHLYPDSTEDELKLILSIYKARESQRQRAEAAPLPPPSPNPDDSEESQLATQTAGQRPPRPPGKPPEPPTGTGTEPSPLPGPAPIAEQPPVQTTAVRPAPTSREGAPEPAPAPPPTEPQPRSQAEPRAERVTGLGLASLQDKIGDEEGDIHNQAVRLLAGERREVAKNERPPAYRIIKRMRAGSRENYMDARLVQYHETYAHDIISALDLKLNRLPSDFQDLLRRQAQLELEAEADSMGLKGKKKEKWVEGRHREQRKARRQENKEIKARNKQRKANGEPITESRDSYLLAATRHQHALDNQEKKIALKLRGSLGMTAEQINADPILKRNAALIAEYKKLLSGEFETTNAVARRVVEGSEAIRTAFGEKFAKYELSPEMQKYFQDKVLLPFYQQAFQGGITDELLLQFDFNAQGVFFSEAFTKWQALMPPDVRRNLDLSLSWGMSGLKEYAKSEVDRLRQLNVHFETLDDIKKYVATITFDAVNVGTLKAGESIDIQKNWWQRKLGSTVRREQIDRLYERIGTGALADMERRFAPDATNAAFVRAGMIKNILGITGPGIGPGSATLAIMAGMALGLGRSGLTWGGRAAVGGAVIGVSIATTPLAPLLVAAGVVGGLKYIQEHKRAKREESQVAIQYARHEVGPVGANRRLNIEKRLFKGREAISVTQELNNQIRFLQELGNQPIPEATLSNILANLADMQARDRIATTSHRTRMGHRLGNMSEMYRAEGTERDTMLLRRGELMRLLRSHDLSNLTELQRRAGIPIVDLNGTISRLADSVENNLLRGTKIESTVQTIFGLREVDVSIQKCERALRNYRRKRGAGMGLMTAGFSIVGGETVGKLTHTLAESLINYPGFGKVIEFFTSKPTSSKETTSQAFQEFVKQNKAPDGTRWVMDQQHPGNVDLVYTDKKLNSDLGPLINNLHQTKTGTWYYDIKGSDIKPDHLADFVKAPTATTSVAAEAIPGMAGKSIEEVWKSFNLPTPQGTHVAFAQGGQQMNLDFTSADGKVMHLTNLHIDNKGGLTWDATSDPEAVKQFQAFYEQIPTGPTKVDVLGHNGLWDQSSGRVGHQYWYDEQIVGKSDHQELQLDNYRVGNKQAVTWDITRMHGTAVTTDGDLPPLNVDHAIQNNDVYMAYWSPSKPHEQILIQMSHGKLTLDQNSSKMIDVLINGQPKQMSESAVAKMIFSEHLGEFKSNSDGTGFMDKFNVNASAVTIVKHPDGTIDTRSLATSIGHGKIPHDIVQPGHKLPPLHEPEKPPIGQGRPDFKIPFVPIILPTTRRPLEKTVKGQPTTTELPTRGLRPPGPDITREPWRPRPDQFPPAREGERFPIGPQQQQTISVTPGTTLGGQPITNIQTTPEGIVINFGEGPSQLIPTHLQDPNFPIIHEVIDVFHSQAGNWYITAKGSDGIDRPYPLETIKDWQAPRVAPIPEFRDNGMRITNYTFVPPTPNTPGYWNPEYGNPAQIAQILGREPTPQDNNLINAGIAIRDLPLIYAAQNVTGRQFSQEEYNTLAESARRQGAPIAVNDFIASLNLNPGQLNYVLLNRSLPHPPIAGSEGLGYSPEMPLVVGQYPRIIPLSTASKQPARYKGDIIQGIDITAHANNGYFSLVFPDGHTKELSLIRRHNGHTYTLNNIYIHPDPRVGYVATVADNKGNLTTHPLPEVLNIWKDQNKQPKKEQKTEQKHRREEQRNQSTLESRIIGTSGERRRANIFINAAPLEKPETQTKPGEYIFSAIGNPFVIQEIHPDKIIVSPPNRQGEPLTINHTEFTNWSRLNNSRNEPIGLENYLRYIGQGERGIDIFRRFLNEAEQAGINPAIASQFFLGTFFEIERLDIHNGETLTNNPATVNNYINNIYRQFNLTYDNSTITSGREISKKYLNAIEELFHGTPAPWENYAPIAQKNNVSPGDIIFDPSGLPRVVTDINRNNISYRNFYEDISPWKKDTMTYDIHRDDWESWSTLNNDLGQPISIETYLKLRSNLSQDQIQDVTNTMQDFLNQVDSPKASQLFLWMFLRLRQMDRLNMQRPTKEDQIDRFITHTIYEELPDGRKEREEYQRLLPAMRQLYLQLTHDVIGAKNPQYEFSADALRLNQQIEPHVTTSSHGTLRDVLSRDNLRPKGRVNKQQKNNQTSQPQESNIPAITDQQINEPEQIPQSPPPTPNPEVHEANIRKIQRARELYQMQGKTPRYSTGTYAIDTTGLTNRAEPLTPTEELLAQNQNRTLGKRFSQRFPRASRMVGRLFNRNRTSQQTSTTAEPSQTPDQNPEEANEKLITPEEQNT